MDNSAASERSFARDARAKKRDAAIAIGIDDTFIALLVDRFYSAVRADPLIGPIFAERIEDWPAHLEQMNRFWRSILHNSGEFSGSPMRKHAAIPGLELGHFERWLRLFYATLRSIEIDPAATRHISEKARTIAESLLVGIHFDKDGIGGVLRKEELPHA